MIANNSSGGIHTLGYGRTIDYLDMVNVAYSDGNLGSIGGGNTNINYDRNHGDDDNIAKLYKLLSLRSNMELIDKRYPKVTKNSCGYRLDEVMRNKKILCTQNICSLRGNIRNRNFGKTKNCRYSTL